MERATSLNLQIAEPRTVGQARQAFRFPRRIRRSTTAFLLLVALLSPAWGACHWARAQASLPAFPPDKELADQLLGLAGEGFRIHETDHFVIAYDTSYEQLRPLVGRLEGTFDAVWRFAVKSGIDAAPPTKRLRVMFFDKQAGYARQANEVRIDPVSVAGFYSPQNDLAVFSNTLTRPAIQSITREMERLGERIKRSRQSGRNNRGARQRREALARQVSSLRMQRDRLVDQFNKLVIQHEASHQVFFKIGVHSAHGENPPWLAEGLACQFEVPQARRDGRLTTVNHMRLADFRGALGVDRNVKRLSDETFRSAVKSPAWVPLREFVRDHGRFREGGVDMAHRYGQAWGLVFYLGRKHSESFAAYISKLAQSKLNSPVTPDQRLAAFESAFGPVDVLQRNWMAFMLPLRVDWQAAGR